jgi:hypothetical protein
MLNPFRELAVATMRVTQTVTKSFDFLTSNGVATPMPNVAGALPEHARVQFPSAFLGMKCDIVVVWNIADFPGDRHCSSYYDPRSPWYNVFFGAYGIRSLKPDGSYWGYKPDGTPDFDEIFQIPKKDYNDLTAGQLGCPPEKRVFQIRDFRTDKVGRWDHADVHCIIPSGVHRALEIESLEDWLAESGIKPEDWPNPSYYLIFGKPDERMIPAGTPSYEPVEMRGDLFFRKIDEKRTERPLTLVFGSCCPVANGGQALRAQIVAALSALYP